ncbi:MAG TPA: response regulator, partial [Pyrinomonadaceae bacterium]|nr:response regulator [Pyrinomonadaceae bacterium]
KQRIFEPFYTTKKTGEGTGLGLATVYGIIKQSEGYIWADSEIGKGTTFDVYLPRVEAEVESSAENKLSDKIQGGTETILLVEDEDMVRNLSRQILEICGYQVIEARNGIEALTLSESRNQKIDLLLTDVVMPQMGGRELMEKLSTLHPGISVLFTSGYTDDAVLRQGVQAEDMNFIQKPFTLDALAHKVRKCLDNKT